MNIEEHRARARRIERSLAKCALDDFEMKIEGAMLAGTHWLNASLHRMGVTAPQNDVFHTYLLTVNEFRRLSLADQGAINALVEIEDMRPAFVRGNFPGGQDAARRALALLSVIRGKAKEE